MSNNRYLEFDSTYRDRNLYPEPADFVIEMSQSGQNGRLTAKDPISDMAPILFWNNSFQEAKATNITGTLTVQNPGTDPSYLNVSFTAGEARNVQDFYNGAILKLTISGVDYERRILSYEPILSTEALIRVDSPFPGNPVLTTGTIVNPTPIPTNSTPPTVVKFYIPGGSYIDNFYRDYYVHDITNNVYRKITFYDGTTKYATLDSPTPIDWSVASPGLNFAIRKEIPSRTTIQSSYNYAVQLDSTTSGESGYYVNSFLRMINPLPTSGSSVTAPYSQIRKIGKYIAGTGRLVAISGTSFTLDYNASNVDNYYVGCFITSGATTARIVSYNGLTKSGTTDAGLGASVGDPWYIRTAFLASPFTASPNTLVSEILYYSRDSWNPFAYTGSMVSSEQMICYEVELLNLILPNLLLQSGRGGRPAFYPYLYVELQQVSASNSGNTNIIYSNNPHSTKMLFRAVVDDTPTPLISPFIKIDGDGMVHVIKFKPNDAFHLVIRHADGSLFKTVQEDFYSPNAPNPLVQISACFAFRKV